MISAEQNTHSNSIIFYFKRSKSNEVPYLLKVPLVANSDEMEILACRNAIEFAMEAGFTNLVTQGETTHVSRLGHIVQLSLISKCSSRVCNGGP